jgi:hypothetical protein
MSSDTTSDHLLGALRHKIEEATASCPHAFLPTFMELVDTITAFTTHVEVQSAVKPEFLGSPMRRAATATLASAAKAPTVDLFTAAEKQEACLGTFVGATLLLPRAKCDVAFYPTYCFIQLGGQGKSAFPIRYANITRLLALPKTSGEFTLAIGLQEPVVQGTWPLL